MSVEVEVVSPSDTRAVLEFRRGIERDGAPDRVILELDNGITIGELVRVLTPAGFVVSTLCTGIQCIHRAPPQEVA